MRVFVLIAFCFGGVLLTVSLLYQQAVMPLLIQVDCLFCTVGHLVAAL